MEENESEKIKQVIYLDKFFKNIKENWLYFFLIFLLVLSIIIYKIFKTNFFIMQMLFFLILLIGYTTFKYFKF